MARRIRGSVSKASLNQESSALLSVEVCGLALIAGFHGGWLAGGGAFALLVFWVMSDWVFLLVIGLSLVWGYLGWVVGAIVGGLPGGIVCAGLVGTIAAAIHHSGAQYVRDVSDEGQMEL